MKKTELTPDIMRSAQECIKSFMNLLKHGNGRLALAALCTLTTALADAVDVPPVKVAEDVLKTIKENPISELVPEGGAS